jgi:hypothetical protein
LKEFPYRTNEKKQQRKTQKNWTTDCQYASLHSNFVKKYLPLPASRLLFNEKQDFQNFLYLAKIQQFRKAPEEIFSSLCSVKPILTICSKYEDEGGVREYSIFGVEMFLKGRSRAHTLPVSPNPLG